MNTNTEITPKKCKQCTKKVAWIGVYVNLVLVVLKIFIGITSGSKACIADGLHSASNIITSFAITLSQKVSSKKSNETFHYGFGKFEFLAAGFITLLIVTGAIVLVIFSFEHMFNKNASPPHFSAMLIAIVSIGANEMLFRYMRCVGTRAKSQSIIATAWANRADCFSSLAVILGVCGAKLGIHHLDPVAALFVVIIIIKVSIGILVESVKALMDSSMNRIYGEQITRIAMEDKDVKCISNLKTRQNGQKIWVDLEIAVGEFCTISQSQLIAKRVRAKLFAHIKDLDRVLVHCSVKKNKKAIS